MKSPSTKAFLPTLSQQLQEYFDTHHISQRELAGRAKISAPYMSDLITGRRLGGIHIAHVLESITHGEINAEEALHASLAVEISTWRDENHWKAPRR